jgi:hypothetical protein
MYENCATKFDFRRRKPGSGVPKKNYEKKKKQKNPKALSGLQEFFGAEKHKT